MEGVIGSGFRGDIAIDDIAMTKGTCPLPGNCDFEKGMCTWMNIGGDTFDWRLGKGATPSGNTGPNSDHTLGTPKGNLVLYLFNEDSLSLKATSRFPHKYQNVNYEFI